MNGADEDYSWWFDWSSEWWRKYESSWSEYEATEQSEFSSPEGGTSSDFTPGMPGTAEGPTGMPYTNPATMLGTSFTGGPETQEPPISGTASASETSSTFEDGSSQGSESSVPPEKKRRRRRSPLRVIPDPITGKLKQRPRNRQRRDAPSSSDSEGDYNERFDWWEPEWTDEEFEYHDYDWTQVDGEDDWIGYYEQSTAADFSDLLDVVNPTREELQELGHQAEDFILQCTFDRKACNYTYVHIFLLLDSCLDNMA